VVNGRYFGQDVVFDTRAMRILDAVKHLIASPFWSVDIAKRMDDEFRIVEIGDGQVSDLVGWTPERFAEIWLKFDANYANSSEESEGRYGGED